VSEKQKFKRNKECEGLKRIYAGKRSLRNEVGQIWENSARIFLLIAIVW